MELSEYIRILRKNWVIIVVAITAGIGLSAAFSFTRTPLYESSSTLFVQSQAGATITELQQGTRFTESRMATYASIATKPIVLEPVIEELGLDVSPRELAENVTATTPSNETLITVTAVDPDPDQAAVISNAVADSLTEAVETIETPNGADMSPVRVTRVERAEAAETPASPDIPLNLTLGALIGIALAIGGTAMRQVLDTRIRSARDLNQIATIPLLGSIAFDPKAKQRPLITHASPLSARAESFRAFRTNLQYLDMAGRPSFVITSAMPGEGKSTTAINLAIALADAGQRVALVDADLRKPKVADYLSLEGGAGLSDILIGRVALEDVLVRWGDRSMFVLPSGKIPPNPSELLSSRRMQSLLEDLEREFDVVLCDAPPVLPVTDAAVLSRSTGGTIVIVAAGRTNRHQVEASLASLQAVNAKIVGAVLTRVPTRGPDSHYSTSRYAYRVPTRRAAPRRGSRRGSQATPDAGAPLPPHETGAPLGSAPAAEEEARRG